MHTFRQESHTYVHLRDRERKREERKGERRKDRREKRREGERGKEVKRENMSTDPSPGWTSNLEHRCDIKVTSVVPGLLPPLPAWLVPTAQNQGIGLRMQHYINQAWWCTHIILALGRWRQQDHKFKVVLGYIPSLRMAWVTRDCV